MLFLALVILNLLNLSNETFSFWHIYYQLLCSHSLVIIILHLVFKSSPFKIIFNAHKRSFCQANTGYDINSECINITSARKFWQNCPSPVQNSMRTMWWWPAEGLHVTEAQVGDLQALKVDWSSQVHWLSKASLIYVSEKKSLLMATESHIKCPASFLPVANIDSFVLKLLYLPLRHKQTILENLHVQHSQQGINKILLAFGEP